MHIWGGGTLWKEGNTDLFTPVLRKNGLSPRLRLFTAVSGKAQGLFCGPSEAEEQLNRAGLGWEGVPGSHCFWGPVTRARRLEEEREKNFPDWPSGLAQVTAASSASL